MLGCGAALDPVADLWVHELAGQGRPGAARPGVPPVLLRPGRRVDRLRRRVAARCCARELERRSGAVQEAAEGGTAGRQGDPRAGRAVAAGCVPLVCDRSTRCQNLFMHPELRRAGRRRRRLRDPARPRLRHHPGAGDAAAGQRDSLPDRDQRQRHAPVLPEGPRPGRERHDPRHVGATRTGTTADGVPRQDRRRARLAEGPTATRRSSGPTTSTCPPPSGSPPAPAPCARQAGRAVRLRARRGRRRRARAASSPTCWRCSAATRKLWSETIAEPGCPSACPGRTPTSPRTAVSSQLRGPGRTRSRTSASRAGRAGRMRAGRRGGSRAGWPMRRAARRWRGLRERWHEPTRADLRKRRSPLHGRCAATR